MTSEAHTSSKSPDDGMDVDGINPADQDEEGSNVEAEENGGLRISEDIYIPPPPKLFGEYDTTAPRLMLLKIVAKNFKSYAGTVEIGPFHKVESTPNFTFIFLCRNFKVCFWLQCFSAVVGPNGNGKSNAVDSMLFVFSFRSSKIRAKKISELIHNSSEHPNCTSCSVSIHFHQIIDKVLC